MTMTEPSDISIAAEFAPYFDGLRRRLISFPCCRACGRTHWYPMKRCPYCYGQAFAWNPIAGPGRLYSWTVVRRGFSRASPTPPYIVGLVEFDEVPGVRLITNIVDCDPADLTIDAAVRPVFSDPADVAPTVRFRLAGGDGRTAPQ